MFGPGGSHESSQIVVVEHTLAENRQHVLDKLEEVETLGGEGLMLRKAGSYDALFYLFSHLLTIASLSVCTKGDAQRRL